MAIEAALPPLWPEEISHEKGQQQSRQQAGNRVDLEGASPVVAGDGCLLNFDQRVSPRQVVSASAGSRHRRR